MVITYLKESAFQGSNQKRKACATNTKDKCCKSNEHYLYFTFGVSQLSLTRSAVEEQLKYIQILAYKFNHNCFLPFCHIVKLQRHKVTPHQGCA